MSNEAKQDQHGISRRNLIKAAGAGAGALALGGGALALKDAFAPESVEAASSFIKGADISWAQQMSANGYIWKNSSGVEQDIFTILKGYGINAIRLRTWVNPSSDPVSGHCSIDETTAYAVQCKNAGLKVLIDFHFGDTWNDVGHQNPPAAWANDTYSEMLSHMSGYVYHSMNVLKYYHVTPDWVQIGNEINSGICHPVGELSRNPTQMSGLLNTAYDEVKAVFSSTPVMIHLAQPQNYSSIQAFFNTHKANGGKWDITAFSSYGSGSEIPGIVSNMKQAHSDWGKPVMQVEFGGPESRGSQVKNDMITYINGLKGFGGLGLFYWEPEGYAPFTTYTLGAWDSSTKEPNAALQGFIGQ